MIPANPSTLPFDKRPFRETWKGTVLNVGVMAAATGLVATLALPGYAIDPAANAVGSDAASTASAAFAGPAQQLTVVAPTSSAQTVERDAITATTVEELEAIRAAEAAEAAEAAAAEAAALAQAAAAERASAPAAASSSAAPAPARSAVAPPAPNFSLAAIASYGQQFVGTPYRFGGADPSGFDCSGFIKYVYAQFGISLPHGVIQQDAAGTRISRADAVPGDLVIMPGHNGIYMGNGMIMDAPKPGAFVSVRPIWTDNYWIVRIGI